jgi:hypothetical protein
LAGTAIALNDCARSGHHGLVTAIPLRLMMPAMPEVPAAPDAPGVIGVRKVGDDDADPDADLRGMPDRASPRRAEPR